MGSVSHRCSPFLLPGAPASPLRPLPIHLRGPTRGPTLPPSPASGGRGARSPGKSEEGTLMDRTAQEAQRLQIRLPLLRARLHVEVVLMR